MSGGLIERGAVGFAWRVRPARRVLLSFPRGRARASLLTRFFGRGYAEFNRTGRIPREITRPDISIRQAAELLGTVGTFQGHAGLDRIIDELREAWDDLRFDPVSFLDAAPRFLVVVRFSGIGKGSGAPMSKDIAHVFTVTDGMRADRLEVYWEPEEGREALGLHG